MKSQTKEPLIIPVTGKAIVSTPAADVKAMIPTPAVSKSEKALITYRKVEEKDYENILSLQQENFRSGVTEEDKQNGFLSAKFTKDQFMAMNEDLGIIVAIKGKILVGYLCGASFDYCKQFPLLKETIDDISTHQRKINDTPMTSENTFFYGPVCIAKEERGQGILEGLFYALKKVAINHVKHYNNCAFFMSPDNVRSSNAHQKRLGVRNIGSFFSQTRNKEFYLFARELEVPKLIANPAVQMTGFGSRLFSGKIQLWSLDEVRSNNVYRP
ncbi:hypothetical protein AYO45_04120 [Gammaproteobacteria bacterium SCGC AG-212-F23]|nr:hypothetical protein AYO45_04120 [Gammaproteobacteria bacterium SCGC AG-212-F23]